MNILSLDAASVSYSACVMRNGKITAYNYGNNSLTHSQTLLKSVKDVLERSELTIKDIDKIAITVGPGSFTGIKIGVATAKGLAFAYNTPCTAVSTQEALAYGVKLFEGKIVTVMDARRSQFYNAVFSSCNGVLERLTPDRQTTSEEILNGLSDEPFIITGDGMLLFKKFCDEKNINCFTAPESQKYISAQAVAEIVYSGGGAECSHEALVPVYLRLSQAERERNEKEKNRKE